MVKSMCSSMVWLNLQLSWVTNPLIPYWSILIYIPYPIISYPYLNWLTDHSTGSPMPTLALPTRRFFGGRQFAEAERCLAQLASDETQEEEDPRWVLSMSSISPMVSCLWVKQCHKPLTWLGMVSLYYPKPHINIIKKVFWLGDGKHM